MKKLTFVLFLVLGCASNKTIREKASLSPLPLNTCEAVETFLKKDLTSFQDEVDEASKNYQEEQWKVETANPEASNEKLSKLFEVVQEKTYNKDILKQAQAIGEASKNIKACASKRNFERAKSLLETTILTDEKLIQKEKANQDLQDAFVNKSNAFRMQVEGEAESLSQALLGKKIASLEDRTLREKLYKTYMGKRAKEWLAWGFKDLIKARNEEAKLAGYTNYYDYKFFRSQLDLKNYRSLVQDIRKNLSPKLKKIIQNWGKVNKIPKVEMWDLRYLREKSSSGKINESLKDLPENEVMGLAKRFYSALGIDVDSYGFTMDLYPRPGKNTHAFAMGIVPYHVNEKKEVLPEPKPDIRFLANLKKPVIWDDVSTVIHELGHAIHYGEIRQPLAILRGFGSVETEAIAMTVERMADSKEFLSTAIPALSESVLNEHINAARVEQAFVLLRQVFFSDFEYEIYKNPDQDYPALWRKMHQEYWGVDAPVESSNWDIEHFSMAPVYVQNYAIGIVMVEQFYESIVKDFKTSYNSKALGDKLKNVYFAPGLEFDYLELTKNFTGKTLSAKAALKLLP